MKIETKLNIGDKIFFLNDKKVISSVVQRIRIEAYGDSVDILYVCNNDGDKVIGIKVEEKYAFETKEGLLKSL